MDIKDEIWKPKSNAGHFILLREAFKKYLQKTYGIFHIFPPSPPQTYEKSATFF